MGVWTRFGLIMPARGLPAGIIRVGSFKGRPAYVDFPTASAQAWGITKDKAQHVYLYHSTTTPTLLAWQFTKHAAPPGYTGGEPGRVGYTLQVARVWCGTLLRKANIGTGYYLAHREGAWLVVADMAKPLDV